MPKLKTRSPPNEFCAQRGWMAHRNVFARDEVRARSLISSGGAREPGRRRSLASTREGGSKNRKPNVRSSAHWSLFKIHCK